MEVILHFFLVLWFPHFRCIFCTVARPVPKKRCICIVAITTDLLIKLPEGPLYLGFLTLTRSALSVETSNSRFLTYVDHVSLELRG